MVDNVPEDDGWINLKWM